jgi:hypothetical protein
MRRFPLPLPSAHLAPSLGGLVLLACAAAAQVPAGAELPCTPAPLVAPGTIGPYSAVPAPAWTDLFDRESGWTGADGVYSIPLSGDGRPCAGIRARTWFTFGDSFIGEVDELGNRLPGTVMVRNTQALLAGGVESPGAIEFLWKVDAAGVAGAMITPDTAPDELLWGLDGTVVDGELVLFALRLEPSDDAFGVAIAGVSQLAWTIGPGKPFDTYTQTQTPLIDGLDTYGRALLANTAAAHAPAPDGFVYVYGLREKPLDKQLLVARVPPDRIRDFGAYRFWDGAAWSPRIQAAAPLVHRMSSEFSVSPLADGRVILVYQQDDFLGPDVTVRIGDGPTGPFGPVIPVYTIPETALDPDIYAYGAKAHPHLSRPDRLLISYHVNTFDFWDHFKDADIYRPRFVELPLAR